MWNTIRSFITHPLVAGPLGGSIVVLLAYIDAKIKDVEREQVTYYKLFFVSALVVAVLVYFVSEEYTKVDEFLNQEYEVELNSSMMPRDRGGYGVAQPYQPEMKGPKDNISSMMENLDPNDVQLVSPAETPKMPPSIFKDKSHRKVSMEMKRVKPKSSKHSRKSHGHRRSKKH